MDVEQRAVASTYMERAHHHCLVIVMVCMLSYLLIVVVVEIAEGSASIPSCTTRSVSSRY